MSLHRAWDFVDCLCREAMGAQESKLSFRRGIFRLHEERHIPKDDPYWANYWTLPETAEDVFTLFSAPDIRKARDEAPENMETLVLAICRKLFELRRHPQFPGPEAPEREMLNCLRLLTRVIPFFFEALTEEDDIIEFLWKDDNSSSGTNPTASDDEPVDDDHDRTPREGELDRKAIDEGYHWKQDTADHKDSNLVAEKLTRILVELLFFCNFTIPANYGDERVVYGIWDTGVGCTVPMGTTSQFESNKIETLRCLLALISKGMYRSASQSRDNRHITHLVMTIPKNIVLALLCSLLNTTMKFNPTTWRTIPYTSAFLSDSRQLLVSYSLQFLLIVLCYPMPKNGASIYEGYKPEGQKSPVNQFQHYFKRLHRANDFNFMVEGMSRILHQPLSASTAILPGSQTALRFYPEMMLLFWETLQQNKRFRSFLVETDRALDFLVVLLFYALEHKTDPSQIGLVRMCVFILQPLSAEPRFAKSLNRIFEGQSSLPASVRIPSFHGTYADFLIISIYSLIATSKGHLITLYSALFMTLSNIAPYIKSISVMASTRLVQLFSSISQPSFLFANDSNFKLLQYILEVLNSAIAHNFNENPHLMYAILRSHKRFEALQDLTLSSGLQIISDIKKSKAQKSRERESFSAVKQTTGTNEDDLDDSHLNGTKIDPQARRSNDAEKISTTDGSTANVTLPTNGLSSRKPSISSEHEYFPPSPRVMSEKARGKLPEGAVIHRQNSSSSIQSVNSVKQRPPSLDEDFNPSSDWFETWFPDLEMGDIAAVLNQMQAEVMRISQETPDPRPIVKFLQSASLKGVTPQTPNPRSFIWSEEAKVWFESLLFGYIYISETRVGNGAVGVWTGTNVKLFRVQNNAGSSSSDSTLFFKIGHGVDVVASQLASKFTSATT